MDAAAKFTPTALRRWSCQDRQLPPVAQIKHVHVYDFDNTLFRSPLPNKQLWNVHTFGLLQGQDCFVDGGWWHNPKILAATGQGVEKEEARAWQGCWNELIVDLVRSSMSETDTLSILLTGRQEAAFAELIGRMVASKGLVFDAVVLRPKVGPSNETLPNTLAFKHTFLAETMNTYTQAEEIRVYEDRPKHAKGFRDFFEQLNKSISSGSTPRASTFAVEVIQVSEQDSFMDSVTEVAEVQRMINAHNQHIMDGSAPSFAIPYKIKRSVFYTGYIIPPENTEQLRQLVRLPSNFPAHEMRWYANNILITPRPANKALLESVGGIDAKMTWRVTGVGNHEQRIWAARVAPVPANARVTTVNDVPIVVLAARRQSKSFDASLIANWAPVEHNLAIQFTTTVGEKALLRVEKEIPGEDEYEASRQVYGRTKKRGRDEDFPPLGSQKNGQRRIVPPTPIARNQPSGHGQFPVWQNRNGEGIGSAAQRGGGAHQGRGGGVGRGGGRGFPGGRGRGSQLGGRRGGRGGYKSLDDQRNQAGYGEAGAMQY